MKNTVGLTRRAGCHDLFDEPAERHDSGGVLAAADDCCVVHVEGGQVGQRSATSVFVFDAHRPGGGRWQGHMFAGAGLDGGLLIDRDHELVGFEVSAGPTAVVQAQHPAGLDVEVRVAREDPRAVPPRL